MAPMLGSLSEMNCSKSGTLLLMFAICRFKDRIALLEVAVGCRDRLNGEPFIGR